MSDASSGTPRTAPDDTATAPAVPTTAKIIVTGPFGIGKTTFIGAVSEINPLRTEALLQNDAEVREARKDETTVAMDFGRITLASDLILYLYGTPGQARFRFMWEVLSRGMLGFVLMVDPEPARLDEAHTNLTFFREYGTPYVVAMNRFGPPGDGDEARIRGALGVPDGVPVISCDPRDRESVKRVLVAFLEQAIRILLAARATMGA